MMLLISEEIKLFILKIIKLKRFDNFSFTTVFNLSFKFLALFSLFFEILFILFINSTGSVIYLSKDLFIISFPKFEYCEIPFSIKFL